MTRHLSGLGDVIRVLYVDDDEYNLQVAKAFLEKEEDIHIDTVTDGCEAFDSIIAGWYDVVVTDLLMPGKDGIDLLKGVRGEGCDIPFIIISAKGREEVVLRAFSEGADYYVQKGGEQRSQFLELVSKIRKSHLSRVREKELCRLKTAMQSSKDGIAVFDDGYRLSYANESFVHLFGHPTIEGPKGIGLYELMNSFHGHYDYRKLEMDLMEKGYHISRKPMYIDDCTRLMFDISLTALDKGGFILMVRDMTELEDALDLAQENARRNEETRFLLESVLQTQTEMICRFDGDTILTYVNDAYCRYFRRSPKDLIGKRSLDFIPELWHASIIENISKMSPDNPALNYAHEVVRENGELAWQEWTDRAMFSPAGELLYIQSVGRDITDEVRAREERDRESHLREVLVEIMSDFITSRIEGYEQSVQESLRQIGEFVGVDRTYVFEYDFRNHVCNNTHEWCDEGIEPQIMNLQRIPLSKIEDWTEAHRRGDVIHIPDVASHGCDGVKTLLEPQGVRSLLSIPLMDGNGCKGFVGFDSVRREREFNDTEISILRVFSEMLVVLRARMEAERDLRHINELNLTLIDNYPDVVYALDLKGNVIYISGNVKGIFGYDPAEIKENGLDTIVVPDGRFMEEIDLKLIQDMIDDGSTDDVMSIPFDIRSANGDIVSVETTNRLHQEKNGRWIIIGFARKTA